MASLPKLPKRFSWALDEDPISRHRGTSGGKLWYSAPHYFIALLSLCFAAIGFFVPAKEGPVVGYSVGAAGVTLAIACVVWGAVRASRVITHVEVYPSGVLWLDRGKWGGGRWEDFDEVSRVEVYVNGALRTRHVGVKTAHGDEAELHFVLDRWKKMADTILMETTVRKVPEALARFEAGETLRFGEASIDREGLRIGKTRYRFEDLSGIVIANGMIQIFTKGKKDICNAITFAATPNYMVLLKLLDVSDAPKATLGGRRR